MTNIWGFVVQTAEITVMAGIIIFLKTIMKDKLSARWQYGIWTIMAAACLWPAGLYNRYIFRYVQVFIQSCKTLTEQKLNSVFTSADKVVYNKSALPMITGRPQSITDILFVIYVAGILFLAAKYAFSYFRLQKIISSAPDADETVINQIKGVSEKYNLPACNVKVVQGLPSAFIAGIVKPVLILPRERKTDEKVILHELLHLKHKDLWQKVIWTVLRILHWPNPLLQYCFEIINNDMESLCDYRVMEMLEGEQRREYGRILLSMTNEKYPSAFGTTSISNGADFIGERIKAIARFKQYPQGMGFVSVCIVFMLMPLIANGRGTPEKLKHINYAKSGIAFQMQYEEYRMAQMATPAAAIDAYAKMLALGGDEDAIKLAVEPQGMEISGYNLPDMNEIHKYESDILYFVVDMQKKDENTYTAGLMFKDFYRSENKEDYGTNFYIIPVTLVKQSGWKIYQSGDYTYHRLEGIIDSTASPPAADDYKGGVQVEYETGCGKIKLVADNISWNDDVDNSMYVYPYTVFSSSRFDIQTKFTMDEICCNFPNVAVSTASMKDSSEYDSYYSEMQQYLNTSETAGTSSGGYSFINVPMDRAINAYGGVIHNSLIGDTKDFSLPETLQVDIWLGSEKADTHAINLKTGEVYEK